MIEIDLTFEDGSTRVIRAPAPLMFGRGSSCQVQIKHWRVGRQHMRVARSAGAIVLEDLGTLSGTCVNGKRVARHAPVRPDDEIVIGPCMIRICCMSGSKSSPIDPPISSDVESSDTPALHASAVPGESIKQPPDTEPAAAQTAVASPPAFQSKRMSQRRSLHAALIESLDIRRHDVANMSDNLLRAEAARLLAAIVVEDPSLGSDLERDSLCREVLNEAVGLGPLEPLLADSTISEIMVNRYDEIYVERSGRLFRHEAVFSSEQAVLGVIERIVAPIGRRIDESSPMVDARLADGSRVNAVVPPVALKGASLTIRKFPRRRLAMVDLIAAGSLDRHMAEFLVFCVVQRKNMLVSGGTGSGKTTLLNILSNSIPAGERIVTIEDAAELRLNHEHLVSLEARPANVEGRGRIDIRDLVRNALRMRPDRIVVGECRGAEAFDMLAAMNTGHEGSLTTLHANTPRDALARLETMILMAGMDLPLTAIREHVASSIDLLIQQSRLPCGRRAVTAIVEITGTESGRIQLQTLFRYDRARGGAFIGCGLMPTFADEWRDRGYPLDPTIFDRSTLVSDVSMTTDLNRGTAP
jgi:pilus assembly protein CpaF